MRDIKNATMFFPDKLIKIRCIKQIVIFNYLLEKSNSFKNPS